MTEDSNPPPAQSEPASEANSATDNGPASVSAEVRSHDVHHEQVQHLEKKVRASSVGRLTPRPTYMEHLANSRDSQFHLDRRNTSELEHYFHGPRNMDKHSKWPIFMRMHGSVMPKMILPVFFVGAWSTFISCFCKYIHNIGIDDILLTVLGFVVGLALSFRSSTAYERWADGRKYWSLLIQTSRNIARTIWVNTSEREGEKGKEDLLKKLTAMNLILAFAVALKHKLRFEPDMAYDDIAGLVGHLNTFARDAHDPHVVQPRPKTLWKSTGEYLGVSFAESNPRKLVKRSKKPLGHLPLEILNHLSAYVDSCVANGTLISSLHQGQIITGMSSLNEVLTGTERVLDTPLPMAYSIAISQISWVYVLVLPFQLYNSLGWITIPASIVAAYIILGLATIGSEIENPFGEDVNDLPMDTYCRQIAVELDVITATPRPDVNEFINNEDNLVLFPLSDSGFPVWKERSMADIRGALRTKVVASPISAASDASTVLVDVTTKSAQSV